MDTTAFTLVILFAALVAFSSGVPLLEEELQPYQYDQYEQYRPYEIYGQMRERRSPQQRQNPPQQPPPKIPPPQMPQPSRGSVSVTGGHTSGSGGFVRGDYNHKLWESQRNGARLDANTYYQRNWGMPGPRQDYGGGVRLTVPLGRH